MFIECPHCSQMIEIIELNCRIFRCGILKVDYTQIGPHLSKLECDRLTTENLIFGCGKPFRILDTGTNSGTNSSTNSGTNSSTNSGTNSGTNEQLIAVGCDYI